MCLAILLSMGTLQFGYCIYHIRKHGVVFFCASNPINRIEYRSVILLYMEHFGGPESQKQTNKQKDRPTPQKLKADKLSWK